MDLIPAEWVRRVGRRNAFFWHMPHSEEVSQDFTSNRNDCCYSMTIDRSIFCITSRIIEQKIKKNEVPDTSLKKTENTADTNAEKNR